MLNPVPVTAAEAMLTVEVPVLVMVRLWAELLPTETLPKARPAGLAVSVPVPEPDCACLALV